MSHLTYIETRFRNFFYLRNALEKLKIISNREVKSTNASTSRDFYISQQNGHDIHFSWNEQEYKIILDISFWEQPYPITTFLDTIAQQYAIETIIGESQKIGFNSLNSQQNVDKSKTLIIQRYKF